MVDHSRTQRGPRGNAPSKCLEHTDILCFKRRYPKQKRCYSPKFKLFGSSQSFGLAMLLWSTTEKVSLLWQFLGFAVSADVLIEKKIWVAITEYRW